MTPRNSDDLLRNITATLGNLSCHSTRAPTTSSCKSRSHLSDTSPPSPFLLSVDAPLHLAVRFPIENFTFKEESINYYSTYRYTANYTTLRLESNFWIYLTRSRSRLSRKVKFGKWFFEALERLGGRGIVNEERGEIKRAAESADSTGETFDQGLRTPPPASWFSRQGKWRAFSNFRLWIWRGS